MKIQQPGVILAVRNFTVQSPGATVRRMTMTAQPKRERLECRLSAEDKASIEAAASLTKVSVSQFIVDSACKRAQTLLEEHNRIKLTGQGWQAVMAALDNPPEPNEQLQRAFKRLDEDEIWE
ncbi:DUF1778 domain-containing protein [Franconibacter helveticus]|uniref:type II toxin-antitoxin system TacA family antitoxin n=1 Tax=Franconibacter helveticus TaxID=357240 RepID=UPI001EFA228A|nr:DUF1778 domain-containing protein [Franconibacter helveticus]